MRRARDLCFRITRVPRWWIFPTSILLMTGRLTFRLRILSGRLNKSLKVKRLMKRLEGSTEWASMKRRNLLHLMHS